MHFCQHCSVYFCVIVLVNHCCMVPSEVIQYIPAAMQPSRKLFRAQSAQYFTQI